MASVPSYVDRLNADPEWAFQEGSLHFEDKSAVQKTLRKITARLTELGIPHVVAGAMALYRHGFRRFTEDVDLLVTRDGLKAIHDALDGLGYLRVFKGSKKMRDTETGVHIDFLITGDYPGDGKPKPVAFPEPNEAGISMDGVNVLSLPHLIELKLASGMTNANRLKDLADVLEIIKVLKLESSYAELLSFYVRPKFAELWQVAAMADPAEDY